MPRTRARFKLDPDAPELVGHIHDSSGLSQPARSQARAIELLELGLRLRAIDPQDEALVRRDIAHSTLPVDMTDADRQSIAEIAEQRRRREAERASLLDGGLLMSMTLVTVPGRGTLLVMGSPFADLLGRTDATPTARDLPTDGTWTIDIPRTCEHGCHQVFLSCNDQVVTSVDRVESIPEAEMLFERYCGTYPIPEAQRPALRERLLERTRHHVRAYQRREETRGGK